jgi:mannose-6-phosphate isomerase-like protein (cupin superfamily)
MAVLFFNQAPDKELVPGIKAKVAHTESLMTLISEISLGVQEAPLPMHSHPAEQTTYMLDGELLVFIEGEEPRHLKAGDMYYVESNIPHAIQSLSEKIHVIESFSPLRVEFL